MADGGMQFSEEETDATAPEPPAAVADDGATGGPNTEFGTAKEWARLFVQPGQEESEATADDVGEEQAKLLPADLGEQETTAADRLLSELYGDFVHHNDGRNLHDGIPATDDKAICWLYDQVVSHRYRLFRLPDDALGQDVIMT